MTDLLIVYHSQSGANEQLARNAYQAVAANAGQVKVLRAAEACSQDFIEAKVVLFCFAEMNASIAGGMKELLDRIYYPITAAETIIPIAVAMSVGNDGSGALTLFKRIATGLKFKWVAEPMVIKGEPTEKDCEQLAELALGLLEGSLLGIF